MQKHTKPFRLTLAAILVGPALAFAACDGGGGGEEASEERVAAIKQAEEAQKAKAEYTATVEADRAAKAGEAEAPRTPLAAAPAAEWPGLEARLTRCDRIGSVVNVEVELANTGSSPARIEKYDAGDAVLLDEGSGREYAVFTRADGPQATMGLTATVGPGQKTSVFAVFPAGETPDKVTVRLPRLPEFTGVVVRQPEAPAAPPRERRDPVKARQR